MKKLQISPDLSLPLEAVTETFAILAVRGAGKSNTAVVMAEEMFKAGLPWVAVDPKGDWWGIRSSADGKSPGLPVAIFGAVGRKRRNKPEPDLPLEEGAGELIADLIVDERIPCVLDVSAFSEAAKVRFLTAFGTRLFQRNEDPLHLFLEECDDYLPQKPFKEQTRLLHIYTKLLKQGRAFGIGATLVSQRSAVVNKNALTQVGTLIALRTTSPQDRKAIREWVEVKGSDLEIVESLPGLRDGEAWVWSPDFLRTTERVRFRRRETFDSGATPKVGGKPQPPKTLADIDLESVKGRMAQTIERAKAEDPKELRKELARVKRELATRPSEVQVQEVEKVVEIPVLADGEIERLQKAALQLSDAVSTIMDGLRLLPQRGPVRPAPMPVRQPVPRAVPKPVAPTRVESEPIEGVSPSQQRILDALAWLETIGIHHANRVQTAFLASFSPKAGHFQNMLGGLRTAGLIDYPAGGKVALTDAGRTLANQPTTPATTEELHRAVLAKLGGAQGRILQVLIANYPDALSREQVAELANFSPTAGHFQNTLGSLRSLGLIEYPERGYVVALPLLFLEERA